MTWREELMSSLHDPEKLREVAERARTRYVPKYPVPRLDHKMLAAEGRVYEGEYSREPGEDDE